MINCIIIDDEPLAIKLLENHISKIKDLKLVGTGKNAMEAYKILQTQDVDLLFLDIQMPDLSGIDFLKSLAKKPKTIFVTAYREFAVEGFELEAVDYLLKPITFDRFFKSVERVLRNPITPKDKDFIIFKIESFSRKFYLDDVLYFESIGNDVKIFLKKQSFVISKMSISELAQNLKNKHFVRIHRSFVINAKNVSAINSNEVLFEKKPIPVGRSFKREFDEFAEKFINSN